MSENLADRILMDTSNFQAADMSNSMMTNFSFFSLPINLRFLYRTVRVSMMASLFFGTALATAQPLSSPGAHDAMRAPEAMSARPAPAAGAKETIADLRKELADFQVTGNPDYDYATLLQILRQVEHDMAIAELSQGKDSALQRLAREEKSSSTRTTQNLSRWIERFHQFD